MASSDSPRVTGFPPKQTMAVLKKGVIYMVCSGALAKGTTTLFYSNTLNSVPLANEALGRLVNFSDGVFTTAFPAGTFRVTQSGAAGEPVAIAFDFSISS